MPPFPQPAWQVHTPLSKLTESDGLRSSWNGQRAFTSAPALQRWPLSRASKYRRACCGSRVIRIVPSRSDTSSLRPKRHETHPSLCGGNGFPIRDNSDPAYFRRCGAGFGPADQPPLSSWRRRSLTSVPSLFSCSRPGGLGLLFCAWHSARNGRDPFPCGLRHTETRPSARSLGRSLWIWKRPPETGRKPLTVLLTVLDGSSLLRCRKCHCFVTPMSLFLSQMSLFWVSLKRASLFPLNARLKCFACSSGSGWKHCDRRHARWQ